MKRNDTKGIIPNNKMKMKGEIIQINNLNATLKKKKNYKCDTL